MSLTEMLGERKGEGSLCATVKEFDLEYNVEAETWEEGYPRVEPHEEKLMAGLDLGWHICSGLTT